MPITMTINGTTVDLDAGSISIDNVIAQRSTGQVLLTDPTGTLHFAQGNAVQIYDSSSNLVFGGVVTADTEKRIPASVALRHSMQVADWHYLADKRIAAKSYANMTCGAMVADLVSSYLSAEGVVTQVYAADVIARTPVAYYRLGDAVGSGSVADSSGNGYTATVNGGVTLGETSPIVGDSGAAAALFNGSTGYIAAPTGLNPTGWSTITVMFWMLLPSLTWSGNPRIIANAHTDTDNTGVQIWMVSATQIIGAVGIGTTYAGANATFPFVANQWTHVAFVYDGTYPRMYINGVITATGGSNVGTIHASGSGSPINLARNPAYSGDYAHVELAEVQVYDAGLTATQIAADNAQGLTQYVATGPSVTSAVFNYVPVSQCLDAIAENAGYWWNIDINKILHFQPYTAYAAPWTFDGSQAITETSQVTISNGLYRNSQYVTGGTDLTAIQTETRHGDGTSRAFTMSYEMSATAPTITLNSVSQTIGVKGVSSGKQWYWAQGDPIIAQDTSGTVLVSTDTLAVTYQGQYSFVYLSTDTSQVMAQQTVEGGGSGLVESVHAAPNATSSASAAETAASKLQKYAQGGTTLEFMTKTTGLVEGQILTVNLPEHNLVNVGMLIEHITISDPDGVDIYYDVQAVQGPIGTSWVQFFQGLANTQPTATIDLSQSQPLVVIATETASWNWTAVTNVTVYACPVPSATLYPSTTLYPC